MGTSKLRTILDATELLGPCRPAAPGKKTLGWERVCEAIVCVTTLGARRRRWRHLKKSLGAADLLHRTKILVNSRPCDSQDSACDVLDACKHSHLTAMAWAEAQGVSLLLILEDDLYFDLPALPSAIQACERFLERGRSFSTFLFGGVYLEARSTDVPGVLEGKGVQAHAWLLNLKHPTWRRPRRSTDFRMLDLYNLHEGQTFMAYPDVAFQRDFSRGGAPGKAPVYALEEFPFLYRVLTRIGTYFGVRNCWESCARRTNALSKYAGSIEVALLFFSLVSAILLFCLAWLSSKVLRRSTGRRPLSPGPTNG